MPKRNKLQPFEYKKRVLLFFGLVVLIFWTPIRAQSSGEDKWGAWYMYFGTNKIAERWSIHSEVQFRLYETTKNFNQLLLRTGINYHLTPEAIATLGYGYILTDGSFDEIPGEENSKEHRIFQQFILKNSVWKFNFEHRYRLEQRFLDSGTNNDLQHRARYRLQLTYPLNEIVFLNAYDEVFLNFQESVFGQNRLYFAVGFHISNNSSIQLGYLKNHFPRAHYDRFQIGVFFNPDLRSKRTNL